MLRGCVYVCAYVCFSYGNEASKGWLSVSQRFDGSWVEGWRMRDRRMETSGWGWMNNQDLTALVFFFPLQSLYPWQFVEKMSPFPDCYWPFVIFLVYSKFLSPGNITWAHVPRLQIWAATVKLYLYFIWRTVFHSLSIPVFRLNKSHRKMHVWEIIIDSDSK